MFAIFPHKEISAGEQEVAIFWQTAASFRQIKNTDARNSNFAPKIV